MLLFHLASPAATLAMRRHEHHERSYSRHDYAPETAFGCETGRIPFGRLGDLISLDTCDYLTFFSNAMMLATPPIPSQESILTRHHMDDYSTPAKRGVLLSPFCICGDAWTRIDFSAHDYDDLLFCTTEQHGQMACGDYAPERGVLGEVIWRRS